MNPVLIVIPILSILMFDLGLTLRVADFGMLMRAPRPMLVGLAGQILCLPLIATGLIWAFDLSPELALGLMLIACCPGGSSSNVFSALAGGDVALSVSLTACSSIITLFTMPLLLGGMADLPVANLIVQNIALVLVPVAMGMLICNYKPSSADKLHNVLKRISFPALMLLAGIFFISHRSTIMANFGTMGPMVIMLLLAGMAAGAGLSYLFRLDSIRQRTLVIEVGMQNSAQAIALASSPLVFADDTLAIPAIVYALMMNVVLLLYVARYKFTPAAKAVA